MAGLTWSAGAPEPVLFATESRTLFAFLREERDVEGEDEVQVAEFVGCTSVRFGFPGDEVLHGHPLWGRGLEFYALHEIEESSWLTALRSIEKVHRRAAATPFADSKHYFLTFHDTTLEAIARDVVPLATHASMGEAISAMTSAI